MHDTWSQDWIWDLQRLKCQVLGCQLFRPGAAAHQRSLMESLGEGGLRRVGSLRLPNYPWCSSRLPSVPHGTLR